MSLTHWITVHCDEPGCLMWDSKGGGYHYAREARRLARVYGWTRREGRDYCPEHSQR